MANKTKQQDVRMSPVIASMNSNMIGQLDSVAIDNNISRNEVIRRACNYLLSNPKKFNLKIK